jgi:Trm5-related predicted tRNA methylase
MQHSLRHLSNHDLEAAVLCPHTPQDHAKRLKDEIVRRSIRRAALEEIAIEREARIDAEDEYWLRQYVSFPR